MRTLFPGYYRLSDKELSKLWQTCLFTLDANVLLNLYRYSPETREDMLRVLKQIADRLWVPHQAALEYQRNRLEVIAQQHSAYGLIADALKTSRDKLASTLESLKKHPVIQVADLLKKVDRNYKAIELRIRKAQRQHPDLMAHDPIHEALTALLDGKVGDPLPEDRLQALYKAGDTRYTREIPPGYRDAQKPAPQRYGDLVLWRQILDKGKVVKKPIVFVTDDQKEDWWLIFRGKTLGPRPELVQEVNSEAGVVFHMHSPLGFLEESRRHLKSSVKEKAIAELHDIQAQERATRAMSAAFSGAIAAGASAANHRVPIEGLGAPLPFDPRILQEIAAQNSMFKDLERIQAAFNPPGASLIPPDTLAALQSIQSPFTELQRRMAALAVPAPLSPHDSMLKTLEQSSAAYSAIQKQLESFTAALKPFDDPGFIAAVKAAERSAAFLTPNLMSDRGKDPKK